MMASTYKKVIYVTRPAGLGPATYGLEKCHMGSHVLFRKCFTTALLALCSTIAGG